MIGCLIVAAFFGVNFDPSWTNMPTLSKIVPVDTFHYEMIQPDGVKRYFYRRDTRDDILVGERPWLAKICKNKVDVWADPQCTGGQPRTMFTFVNGELKRLFLDGENYEFSNFVATNRADMAKLWPTKPKVDLSKNGKGDIWGDHGRMRLWYANPNSAGMLCAEITLLFIFLATRFHKLPRIGFLLAAIACLILTMKTGSRGALLAVVVGVAFGFADQIRKLARPRNIGWFIMIAAIAFAALYLTGNLEHYLKTFYTIDESNSLRIKVAKAALAMFADAPFGWHGGRFIVREVMLNWYLPGISHTLKTHFTNLAGYGWFAGAFYVWFWLLIVIVSRYIAHCGYRLTAMIWSAFFVAGFLNPVYAKSLWIIPILALIVAFSRSKWRISSKKAMKSIWQSGIAAVIIICALVLFGGFCKQKRQVAVKPCRGGVIVNGSNPEIWVVTDELVFGNRFPGRVISKYFRRKSTTEPCGFVNDVYYLPRQVETLALCGRSATDYLSNFKRDSNSVSKAKRIIFLNPSVSCLDVPERLSEESDIVFFTGSILARQSSEYRDRRHGVFILNGMEFFVPGAMKLILENSYSSTPKRKEKQDEKN